jgi:hypothetical protein
VHAKQVDEAEISVLPALREQEADWVTAGLGHAAEFGLEGARPQVRVVKGESLALNWSLRSSSVMSGGADVGDVTIDEECEDCFGVDRARWSESEVAKEHGGVCALGHRGDCRLAL